MQSAQISALFFASALLVPSAIAQGQETWRAPNEAAARLSPIASTEASIAQGRATFQKACTSCHGKVGLGDGFAAGMLKRKPKNLGEVLGGLTDGDVFWKIRTGNSFMPSSSGALSEEETWHVINFLRTLVPKWPSTHPWASFSAGSWVEVRTDHEVSTREGAELQSWAFDSRVTVVGLMAGEVALRHDEPARGAVRLASVPIPAVDAVPGTRGLGQWAHDIFVLDTVRKSDAASGDQQPKPFGVETKSLREEKVEVGGRSMSAKVVERRWKTDASEATQDHVLLAWVVEGVEIPAKWTLTVDGKLRSESELVSTEGIANVGKVSIPCTVTLTSKRLADGVAVMRQWSSTQVPGFLVRMESEMKTDAYSISMTRYVTGFHPAAKVAASEKKDEGNPPGSRPALGIMPAYESGAGGVLIDQVSKDGPAAKGGLKAGDLIVEIDGEGIQGLDDYMDVMYELRIGREVSVKADRDGKRLELKVVVGER